MSDEQKKKPRKVVPDSITIELSKPIILKGTEETEISEIELKEPTLGQLQAFIKRTAKEHAVECMKWLISEISGVPMLALTNIGVRDYYKAQDYLTAFLTPPDEDDPEGNGEGSQ
ncbi:phage tail assembly protein [Paraburkholderia aromaticivorans]|uniref:Phage tail assembly protein n=1 Tax=Paraburkholderia aromaticivorans TaxID=2026199 RepID=A0A248VM95_9BURK|nr:phage tail assembly protein [Paraburkholderia aromaticivorans]ASW00136.1 hypothetical protein CJU94_19470 [Paraburkholderia aromaticivorans]